MIRRNFLLSSLSVAAFPIAPGRAQNSSSESRPSAELRSKPKFHIGQEVMAPWIDEDGNLRRDRAIVIGIMHNPTGYTPGWWYLPRWIHLPDWLYFMEGKDDGNFWPEEKLKALK